MESRACSWRTQRSNTGREAPQRRPEGGGMSMSRKGYVMVATAVRESRVMDACPCGCDCDTDWEFGQLIDRLCVEFTADNPRFDAARFRAACTGEGKSGQ